MNSKISKFLAKGRIVVLTLCFMLAMLLGVMSVNMPGKEAPVVASAAEVTDPTTAVVGDTYTVQGSTTIPTAPTGMYWENMVKSTDVTCGKEEHNHTSSSCIQLFGRYLCGKSEHAHSEPACYSYTWTLADNVEITISGDGVVVPTGFVAEGYASKVNTSDVFTFTLPQTNNLGWVATVYNGEVGENLKGSFPLNGSETTTIEITEITSGVFNVVLSQQEVYDITLIEPTTDYGSASVNVTKAIDGTVITVTATPTANTDNTKYSLDSITVNGTAISGNTFTVNAANAEVVVTFKMEQLNFGANKNTTIAYNGAYADTTAMDATALNALKQEIFSKLDVTSLPAGATWENVTYQYYQYCDEETIGLIKNGYFDALVSLNATAKADDSDGARKHTYYNFGERAYNDGNTLKDTTEKVRITYNGMFVESEITLTEGRNYTVTWVNYDGTVLETDENVIHGTVPTYDGATPTKAADAQYTYTFEGWTADVVAATAEVTYTAKYTETLNTYTVVWKDADGTVLETDTNVPYGETPAYNDTNGTTAELADKQDNAQYDYSFAGWTPVVSTVSGNVEYTATYSTVVNKYVVTFKNGDAVLATYEVEYGSVPAYAGATPTKAADAQYTYTFAGWDNEFTAVVGAVTYNATFSTTVNTYTVTWKNYDGTVLETDSNVPYGTTPSYDGEAPVKAADGENVYYFDVWAPDIDTVKGDATYTATFTTVAKIKVTFSVLGNTDRYTNVVPGEKVAAYAEPNIAGWEFGGWYADGDCTTAFDFDTAINAAVTVYAKMTKIHTVSFNVSGGDITVAAQEILDGNKAVAPTNNPDKENETFIGWYLGEVLYDFNTAVTADITLVAKYGVDVDNDEKVDGSTEDPFLTYVWMDGEELYSATILSGAAVPTYTITDANDNNKLFVRWDEVVAENTTTYTAVWTTDSNNNDVADENETLNVTLNQSGSGNVTLTPAGNATLLGKEGNVYTYLYDSTDDANKVINVATSLIDTVATDGSIDYLISAPATVNLGETLTVQFGTRAIELNSAPYTIKINKGVDPSDQRQLIYNQILAAVVKTAPSGTATITYMVNIFGWQDIMSSNATLMNTSFNDGSEKVHIEYAANGNIPAVSVEVTVTVEDSRTEYANIELGYTTSSFDAEAQFKAALEDSIKVNGEAYTLNKVSLTPDSITYTKESTGTYTVSINIRGTEDYLDTSKTFTGIEWNVNTYTITWVDGNGATLYSETLAYGATLSYAGADPLKDSTVSTVYTYNGKFNNPATVEGNATYTAQFNESVRSYVISWDIDGDGDVDETETLAYGSMPEAKVAADRSAENKSFNGWSPAIKAVDGDITYTATYTDDTVYTVTFKVDGVTHDTQYINVTQNPNATVVKPDDPDKAYAIFAGWDADIIGKTPTVSLTVNAVWNTNDSNDNNVDDDEEKVSISLPTAGAGSITIGGVAAGESFVFDKTNNSYQIVVTPPATGNNYVKQYVSYFAIVVNNETIFSVGAKSGAVQTIANAEEYTYSYNNGALTVDGVALANGMFIEVEYDEHSIPDVANPEMKVNGHTDYKIASVTKEAVLKAILGLGDDVVLTDDQLNEYVVKMYVRLADLPLIGTIDGYYDIWDLDTDNALIESALAKAIDVGGSESFEITWNAGGQYPAVTERFTVALVEARTLNTVSHNGDTYRASGMTDDLLAAIEEDISASSTFTVAWGNNDGVEFEAGTEVTLTINVTVAENEVYYGTSYTVKVKVYVPYTSATITIPEYVDNLDYNTGMTDTDKEQLVISVINPQFVPELPAGYGYTVWYLANEARNVPMTIHFSQMDLGIYGSIIKNFLGDSITIDIPVDDMWLNIGDDWEIYEQPSNEVIQNILLNDLIPNYGADFIAGQLSSAEMQSIFARILKENPDVANYYKTLGAHYFGEKEQEKVRVTVEDYGYGIATSNVCVLNLVDTRTSLEDVLSADALETLLNPSVTVVYGSYTNDALIASIVASFAKNGIEVSADDFVVESNMATLPVSEATEVTVRFKGNGNYQPCTVTVTATIEKATVEVSIDNQFVKYGSNYNLDPVTTVPEVDCIQFIVGLDVSGVNVDGGFKGFVGTVQLLLPEELQEMLTLVDSLVSEKLGMNISLANGATVKLSDLKAVVDVLDDYTGGTEYAEYFRVLFNLIDSLPTEVADIEVTLGGEIPTNVGAYLIGAVTADENYETAYAIGALVIYPDGTKAEIAWNENDDNYVITNTLLETGAFDAEAHAVSVGAGGNIADATAQIFELFIGMDIDGNLTFQSSAAGLNVGAYLEFAMIVNWGNELYYSNILVRPVVVIAETLDVDFGDASGNVNNDRHYEFDNTEKDGMESHLIVTYKDGTRVDLSNASVRFVYVGVQSNGMPYASRTAPTNAGVYTITAIIVLRDADGKITHAGQGVGVFVIEPSQSETSVENKAILWDGAEHKVGDLVSASSVNVPGLVPDTTIISAGLSVDLDNVTGLDAINGTMNIDLPDWMDSVFAKLNILEAGYADGISAGDFIDYVTALENGLANLGVSTDAFAEIVNVIKQIPITTKLTFHDDKAYSEVGAYLIISVVTDFNHYPSLGAGVMVIYPNAIKVDVAFEEDPNGNNIFTWYALNNGFDLDAQAYLNGEVCDVANVYNLYFGFIDDGKFVLTADQANLDNGIFVQVAFALNIGNTCYYSDPISRVFTVMPTPAEIEFSDGNSVGKEYSFEFDATAHGVDVSVSVVGETVTDLSGLTVTYVGVQSNGAPYNSEIAPTNAGVYAVTATYTERDGKGRLITLGVDVCALVITPSKSETSVDNGAFMWDGAEHKVGDLVSASSVNVPGLVPDTTIISAGLSANLDNVTGLDAINGTMNIDLPAWMDGVFAKLNILEAGYADGISAGDFIDYVTALENGLANLGVSTDAFAEIVDVIKQIPITTKLTFHDDKAYSEVGAYLVISVVTDFNHYPSLGAGVMVIYPNTTKVDLAYTEDPNGNNVFTWYALNNGFDLDAQAYLNGAFHAEADAYVYNLYFGFIDDGKFVLTTDQSTLDNGIYTQVAFVADFGNEFYYAKPVDRQFAIVPTPADIEYADVEFTFNGTAQAPEISISVVGREITDLTNATVKYVGAQSNGLPYVSEVAPTHAGIYTVTVVYTERDAQDRLVTFGTDVCKFVISPATAEISVENELREFDSSYLNVRDMLSVTEGADVAIITASIKTDGTFSENWLDAINKEINIDLPAWADALLAKVGFTGGSLADLVSAIETVEANLEALAAELGLDVEIGVFDPVKNLLTQISGEYNVVLQDNVSYNAVGAYLVIGAVVDSNYYPTLDAGVAVIYPAVNGAKLHWAYEDNNNIFTLDTIAGVNMGVYATVNGETNDSVPVQNIFLGVDMQNWKVVVTDDKAQLAAGNYTQVAYVLGVDSTVYVAAPILRKVIVVTNHYDIDAEDCVTVQENGNPQGVTVNGVINQAQQNIMNDGGELTITYSSAIGNLYLSHTAPSEAGVYLVTITFVTYDANGNPTGKGVKFVTLTITHQYEATVTAPTCTEFGYTTHTCSVCGDSYVTDLVAPNGHSFDAVVTDPTCTEKGYTTYTCHCGESFVANCVPATGHSHSAVVTDPTCTEDGYTTYTCHCGDSYVDNYVPATGHSDSVDDNDHNCDVCGTALSLCADNDNDHNCDVCGTAISLCADNDADHKCDLCEKVISLCVNNNADVDHNCDVCGAVINACADNDNDHKCDVCDATLSLCADNNADHKCDLCEKVISLCVNNNADVDHNCDICGKVINACADNDNDHNCDVCDATLSLCADNNADHKCDLCEKVISLCVNNNADVDHNCDICGKVINACADNDNDHNCDVCDATLSLCADNNADHKCDLCEKVISLCVNNNADVDHNCDICGKVINACADNDNDHNCDVCGTTLSLCVNNNADVDHNCDICGAVVNACADNDNDHNCDVCDAVLTVCVNNNADVDHNCDICGKVINVCADTDNNHNCDVCDAVLTVCVNNNADVDHNCDICGTVINVCADTDNNHNCDVCDAVLTVCVSNDDNHECDICGETISLCASNDDNHECDICGETISLCVNNNADVDHNCDICGKVINVCADTDNNHNCDVCDAVLTVCVSNDDNHECDICGETISLCASNDDNHECDVCGETISLCADNDNDHNCDICGEVLSVCEDGDDDDHDCDTCGANLCASYDNNHFCDICERKISECVDYYRDEEHTCDICGINLCVDEDKDHGCDVDYCNRTVGAHEAASGKHTCDYCGEKATDCADGADDDHDCDTCGKNLCKDSDDNHLCDGCGAVLSECSDNESDDDHNCDLCGVSLCADGDDADHNCDVCGENLCVDADNDHLCDGCGTALSECKDADNNHVCDTCGDKMADLCEDADTDHKCDVCEDVLSQCADANKDHKCDYCRENLSSCADSNKDHKCDVCGEVNSQCADADKNHTCDVCGEELSECADDDENEECDVCGKEMKKDRTGIVVASALGSLPVVSCLGSLGYVKLIKKRRRKKAAEDDGLGEMSSESKEKSKDGDKSEEKPGKKSEKKPGGKK